MSLDDSNDYSYLTKHSDRSKLNLLAHRTQAAKKPTFLKRIPHFSQIDPTQMGQFKVYSPFTFNPSDETDIYEPFNKKKPTTKLTALTKQNRKFKSSNRSLLSSSSSSFSSMSLDDEMVQHVFDSKQKQRSNASKANDRRLVQQAAILLNQKSKKQCSSSNNNTKLKSAQTLNEKILKHSKKQDYDSQTTNGLLLRNIRQEETNQVKTFIKKNPNILINICITNKRPNAKMSSPLLKHTEQLVKKKKSSLLKSSSTSSSSETSNEKKKIKFIYGEQYNRSSNLNRVKFNDVIEFFDPDYNNKTLHQLSDFKTQPKENKFPMVEFCYEEPVKTKLLVAHEPKLLEKGCRQHKPKSDFIYYYDDYVSTEFNESEDLIELDDQQSIKNDSDSYYEQFNDYKPEPIKPQIVNLINKQPIQPVIKTRGIVQIKPNNFLQSYAQLSKEKKEPPNEIGLSIKSDLKSSVNNGSDSDYFKENKQQQQTSESSMDESDKLCFNSFNSKKSIFNRRSSKSGDTTNGNELNSIFKQIYNRNKTLLTSSNTNGTQVPFIRRLSNTNNNMINSTSM